jgi:hypothetical protein
MALYVISAGAALVAATAKTALNIIASAGEDPPLLTELGVSFDGVTATAVPVLIELCSSTQGAAGTKTSFTPLLIRGGEASVPTAARFTAGINYTVEPTTLVVLKHWYVSPTSGLVLQFPLGREIAGVGIAATARLGLALRLTAPAIVNYKAYFEAES